MGAFIIAEAGINANGDIEVAKKLIAGAKYAGADAIKFQKRSINHCYSQEELNKLRESPWGTTNRQQKEGLEFNYEAWQELVHYAQSQTIKIFASAWDVPSQLFLRQFNFEYNKIASAMLGHTQLLASIVEESKHTFISTGMATMPEIDRVVKWFELNKCPYTLLHCNSQYPCVEAEANLRCIRTLMHRFNCRVGYSSHCVGIIDVVAATSMGASVIEKHITLDRAMYGSDQASSVEVDGFKRMVDYIRVTEKALSEPGDKFIWPGEEPIRKKLYRTNDYGG